MSDVIAASQLDVCELWLQRAYDELAACPTSEPIEASYVAAGATAWDSCCGLLVAAPERTYRSPSFPIEGQSDDDCETAMLVVDVLVLLLRCVPTIDDFGNAPKPAELSAAFNAIINDAAIVWNAVTGELPEGWQRANVDQAFVGAEGGCIGVETRLTIGLPQSEWCPDCEVTP